jgi:hypothetical protein
MRGDRAITAIEQATHPRKLCQRKQRPHPPDLAREENYGSGPGEIATIGRNYPHFIGSGATYEPDSPLHPRRLQRKEFESVAMKCFCETTG